jgi:predicted RNA-binding Zn-ribbon protein involved in translation (DUF1610 family)
MEAWDFADRYMAEHGHWPTCEECKEEMQPDDQTHDFKCKKGCNKQKIGDASNAA